MLFTSFIFWKATNLNSLDTSRIVQILTLSLRIKIAFKWWMFVKRNSLVLYSNNLYLAVSVLFSDPLGDSLRPSERKKNATFLFSMEHSQASAQASSVLPVLGGPYRLSAESDRACQSINQSKRWHFKLAIFIFICFYNFLLIPAFRSLVLPGEEEGCVFLSFRRAQTVSKWIGEQNTHC